MQIKAIILDLDNTIYPVYSIESLFDPLLDLVEKDGNHEKDMDRIREETMRRPFHLIAKDYHFSPELTEKCMAHLKELSYQGKIEPFDDYNFIKKLPVDKFLVTTGFPRLQRSKIESMNIKGDFKEIHIVDPSTSSNTKKDTFAAIIKKYGYAIDEVLVVGDDPASEIKAAQDLGIHAILYDKLNLNEGIRETRRITDFRQLNL